MQQAQTYRERSREYLSKAFQELADGDLTQASEKGWGAAAQIIKAVADKRGMRHNQHVLLEDIVEALVRETGETELEDLFDTAGSLHRNFYEGRMTHSAIQRRLQRVQRFIHRVEQMLR
jgi:hypothetical protein